MESKISGETGSHTLPFKRVVLTGFMGSGKTTVGLLLAERLGWKFVDLDDEIERRESRTVAEIFAQSGEALFRRLETEALRSALGVSNAVIALGGGAIEAQTNRDLLAGSDQTLTVLLTAPFVTLYDRCLRQGSEQSAAVRPLLQDRDSTAERLARRDGLYKAVAHVVIDTSGQDPTESTESVLSAMKSTL
jgi:shikimate kinase